MAFRHLNIEHQPNEDFSGLILTTETSDLNIVDKAYVDNACNDGDVLQWDSGSHAWAPIAGYHVGCDVAVPDDEEQLPGLLPAAMRISAQTIGLDLVEVQPMTAPIGNLNYIHYEYNDGLVIYHPVWDPEKTYEADEFFNDNTFDDY